MLSAYSTALKCRKGKQHGTCLKVYCGKCRSAKMSIHIHCTDAYKTHVSARQTLRSAVLIGNGLSVGDEDVCERLDLLRSRCA